MNIMKNMKSKMILAYKYLESVSDYRTAYRTMVPLLSQLFGYISYSNWNVYMA